MSENGSTLQLLQMGGVKSDYSPETGAHLAPAATLTDKPGSKRLEKAIKMVSLALFCLEPDAAAAAVDLDVVLVNVVGI